MKPAISKIYNGIVADFGALSSKYKVLREISRGAYGVVYLAEL